MIGVILHVAPWLLLLAADGGEAPPCGMPAGTTVLAIGSSSIVSPLGPMLQRGLEPDGIRVHVIGRSASGLARPDFFDWPRVAGRIVAREDPDVVVVSLGANDFQGIRQDGRWIRRTHSAWEAIYRQRIDRLLGVLAGPERERLVIWVGPYAFAADNALEQGPIVNRLLRERLMAWRQTGGRAAYVDLWAATVNRRGWPLYERPLPGISTRKVAIRLDDGIHLSANATRALIARPIIEAVRRAGCRSARHRSLDDVAREEGPQDDRVGREEQHHE